MAFDEGLDLSCASAGGGAKESKWDPIAALWCRLSATLTRWSGLGAERELGIARARIPGGIGRDSEDPWHGSNWNRQIERSGAAPSGEGAAGPDIPFASDLYTTFYRQREFSIRDPNGIELNFNHPVEKGSA